MDPGDVVALIGVLGLGSMALVALKMILNYRAARLSGGASPKEVERLGDTVEQLRDQVEVQRAELAELHERVDFAERMLAKTRGEDSPQLGRPRQ